MPKSAPYYPNTTLTYGSLYFFIKGRTHNLNPFDTVSIIEAKQLILREAREASPSYKMFIKAATLATGLSERTIKKFIYSKDL
jgi:hypothetical protein